MDKPKLAQVQMQLVSQGGGVITVAEGEVPTIRYGSSGYLGIIMNFLACLIPRVRVYCDEGMGKFHHTRAMTDALDSALNSLSVANERFVVSEPNYGDEYTCVFISRQPIE